MSKTLYLIRHAHRDKKLGHDSDNGISEKGGKQAKRIHKWFEKNRSEVSPILLSSPKKRCIETIEPLQLLFDSKTEVNLLLNEGSQLETRVEEFFKWWIREAPKEVIACSHGDWIPYAIHLMTGARADCSKGSITQISGASAAPWLINLIQEP